MAYLRVLGGLPAAPTPGTAEQPAGPEQPTGPEQPAAPTVGSPSVALLGYAQTFSGLLDPGADPNDADDAQGKALALAQVAGTRLEALRSAIFGLATAAGGVANASATTAAATTGNTEKMTAAADELTHLVTTADLDEPPQDFDDLKAIAADLALLDELTKAIEAVRASRRGGRIPTRFNPRTLPALGPARTALAQTAALIYHEWMNSRQYTGREGVAATAWHQAYQQILAEVGSTVAVGTVAEQARQAAKQATRQELTSPVPRMPPPTGPSHTEVRQAGQTAYDAALEPLRQNVLPTAQAKQRIAYLEHIRHAVDPDPDAAKEQGQRIGMLVRAEMALVQSSTADPVSRACSTPRSGWPKPRCSSSR